MLTEPANKNIFDEPITTAPILANTTTTTSATIVSSDRSSPLAEKESIQAVEKDIIEYISRKIPTIEEKTQLLGQNMIKLINNKNISAHFCNEQIKKMRKRQKKKYFKNKHTHAVHQLNKTLDQPFYFNMNAKKASNNSSSNECSFRLDASANSLAIGKKRKYSAASRLVAAAVTAATSKTQKGNLNTRSLKNKTKKSKRQATSATNAPNTATNTNNTKANLIINKKFNKKLEGDATECGGDMIQYEQDTQFDASLFMDKGFFTHYTICKYIDDLPDEWSVGTTEDPNDFSKSTTHGDQTGVDSGSNGSPNSSGEANPPVASSEMASRESVKRTLAMTNEAPATAYTPKKESTADMNTSNSDSDKSKSGASNEKSKKFKPNDFTKNYIEFLLKKSDKERTTNAKKRPKNEIEEFKKGLSTISSKSHSKIVLFNEEYDEDNEEEDEEDFEEFEIIQPPAKQGNESILDINKSDDLESSKNTTAKKLNESNGSSSNEQNNNNVIGNNEAKNTSKSNSNPAANDSGSNSNSNNEQQQKKKTTSSNGVSSSISSQKSNEDKDTATYSKFTQEALAKHTMEQDELYTQDIIRKIRCPIKYYSGRKQYRNTDIC